MAFLQNSDTESISSSDVASADIDFGSEDSDKSTDSPSESESDEAGRRRKEAVKHKSAKAYFEYLEKERERQRIYREKNRDRQRVRRALRKHQFLSKLKSFVYSNTDELDISSGAVDEKIITQSLDAPGLREIKNMLKERQIVAEKRKAWQKRYRKKTKKMERQRELERQRLLQKEMAAAGLAVDIDTLQTSLIEPIGDKGLDSLSAAGVEDPMNILTEVPKRGDGEQFLKKKRERQRRYRERNREVLREREKERRRQNRTDTRFLRSKRKSAKNSTAKDGEITNPSDSDVENPKAIKIEVPKSCRSEEDTRSSLEGGRSPRQIKKERSHTDSESARVSTEDCGGDGGDMNVRVADLGRNVCGSEEDSRSSLEGGVSPRQIKKERSHTDSESARVSTEDCGGEYGVNALRVANLGSVADEIQEPPLEDEILNVTPEEIDLKVEEIVYEASSDSSESTEEDTYILPHAPWELENGELSYEEPQHAFFIKTEAIECEEDQGLVKGSEKDWRVPVGVKEDEERVSFERHKVVKTYGRRKK